MSDENNLNENNQNVTETNSYNEMNGEPQKGQSNGLGIASMVLGIVSIVSICCSTYIPFIPIVPGVIAVVLGIVQIVKNEKKGMAIAGIICGAIGLIIYIALLALGTYILSTGMYDELLNYSTY